MTAAVLLFKTINADGDYKETAHTGVVRRTQTSELVLWPVTIDRIVRRTFVFC